MFTDPSKVEWVRALPAEEAGVVFTSARTPSLPPLRLVRRDASQKVKRIERQERRAQRAMKARGYA